MIDSASCQTFGSQPAGRGEGISRRGRENEDCKRVFWAILMELCYYLQMQRIISYTHNQNKEGQMQWQPF
jgi:hypothetical protein